MNSKNLVLEIKNCVGYGFMAYIEFDASRKVYDFLDNFCMWGGSTKTFDNYKMYELSEEIMNFMQTESFKGFLLKNNVKLITERDSEYKDMIKKVFNN